MANTLHQRLREARVAAGYEHASDFAKANDLPEGTYRHHENGTRGVKINALKKYAALMNVSLEWLLTGEKQPSGKMPLLKAEEPNTFSKSNKMFGAFAPKKFIPIIGVLQAGMFKEEIDTEEPIGYVQDIADKRYYGLPRYAKRIVGPSMNNVVPENSVAIFVSLMDLGRDPENGEIVEVIRRDERGFVEATLKRYVVTDAGKYLMPDSSHPEHREPVKLRDNGEDDSVVIRGLMIRAIIDF